MEPFLFAILIATLVTRKGLADIPFMVRGQTPPSHERRMAEMRAREANRERRHMRRVARSSRPRGPARSYASALWQHSWEQAAERRRTRWEHRDPVKAQRYAEKIRAKVDGTYRGPVRRTIDRGRQLHAKARAAATGTPTPTGDPGVVYGDDPDDPNDVAHCGACNGAAVVDGQPCPSCQGRQEARNAAWESVHGRRTAPDPSAAVEPSPRGETAAEAPDGPDVQWPDAADAHLAGTVQIEDEAERYGYLEADDRRTCSTCKTWATPEHVASPEHRAAVDRAAHQYDHDTHTDPKGTSMSALSSEAVGLEAFQAALDEHIAAAEGGPGSLEGLIASAQQQNLGPDITGGLSKANEGYAMVAAGLEEAKKGLQDSVNVGEAYAANPNAGDKDFVTS